jgi:rRNA processing protein Krr1/Pno1
VGKVIGKKGAVITHIQLTTQTEVIVLTITEGSEHWSPVVITGEPFKALQAFELIKDIAEGSSIVL